MIGACAVSTWDDAAMVAALFAIDPVGMGGVSLRAMPGPVRDRWLDLARRLLPAGVPWRRLPLHIGDDRLLGGLDLAATLRSGRPIVLRGILAETDGGVVQLAMAERLASATAARLAAVLDTGEVALERDGLATRHPARLGVLALDEGLTQDERPPPPLLDRLAFHLDLATVSFREGAEVVCSPEAVTGARTRLPIVHAGEEAIEALCAVALAFGIRSARAPLLALRAGRAAAALAGRSIVEETDVVLAARLVLAPRAEVLPAQDPPKAEAERDPPRGDRPEEASADMGQPLGDVVLAAAQAAIPADLLTQLRTAGCAPSRGAPPGRGGDLRLAKLRGRPAGVRPGTPRSGVRLSVVETLRTAAPWQPIRRRKPKGGACRSRIEIRADDFRVIRLKQRTRTTTIFPRARRRSSGWRRLRVRWSSCWRNATCVAIRWR
jgi:magnesium chelatase subunit D